MISIGMQPNHPDRVTGRLVGCDKGHRSRVVEPGQPGEELMAEFPDRIEETKPQVFPCDVLQQRKQKRLVVRPDRPRKHPPAIAEDQMPLPLRWIGANGICLLPWHERSPCRCRSSDFRKRATLTHDALAVAWS